MQNQSYPLQFCAEGERIIFAEWADYQGREYRVSFPVSDFLEALPAGHCPETALLKVEHGGRMIEMEAVILREEDHIDPEREVRTVLSPREWFNDVLPDEAKRAAFMALMGF